MDKMNPERCKLIYLLLLLCQLGERVFSIYKKKIIRPGSRKTALKSGALRRKQSLPPRCGPSRIESENSAWLGLEWHEILGKYSAISTFSVRGTKYSVSFEKHPRGRRRRDPREFMAAQSIMFLIETQLPGLYLGSEGYEWPIRTSIFRQHPMSWGCKSPHFLSLKSVFSG
mgnify:FL=1